MEKSDSTKLLQILNINIYIYIYIYIYCVRKLLILTTCLVVILSQWTQFTINTHSTIDWIINCSLYFYYVSGAP